MRRLSLLFGGLFTIVFLLYGTYTLVDLLAMETKTETRTFEVVPTVHLDSNGGGTIRVVGDGGSTIRADLRWREGLQRASVDLHLDGDRLVVRTLCPRVVNLFCSVSATIHVPEGTRVDGTSSSKVQVVDVAGPVELSSSDGSVRVEGAVGPVSVHGDNGSITVVGGQGPLDLRTDNGSITTEASRAATIDATTDNGRIELDAATAPDRVVARTDNGSITVLVPDDGEPYATNLGSDEGSVDDPIASSPTAGRTIEATTDNGSISVRYREG